MSAAIIACCLLVVATCVLHYEVLGGLQSALPRLAIPNRARLLVVILIAFLAHAIEIALYGLALHVLIAFLHAGTLTSVEHSSFVAALYFSAETYTSLGFGDLAPTGPARLLAGVEALNGLLLIGWSASFTYLSMERFWTGGDTPR
jgi:voltage-gated potassium channel Kch